MQIADLHTHTIYSDGALTPEELIKKAAKNNISIISITDHDSTEGCLLAREYLKENKVELIDGVELSCYYNGIEIHILGYGIDIDSEDIKKHLNLFRIARIHRAEKIVQKLKKLGITVNFDLILEKAGPAPITRPHIAAVLKDLGYVLNSKEAFVSFLGDGAPAWEPKANFSYQEAIKLINTSGGIAVLAHPAFYIEQSVLYKMINAGLDGIEVVHPMHNEDMQRYYRRIANQYWLIETGGSDYHGTREYEEDIFGKYVVPATVVDSMRIRINSR